MICCSLTVRRGRGASLDEWGAPRARRGTVAFAGGLRSVICAVAALWTLRLSVVVDTLAPWAYDRRHLSSPAASRPSWTAR
jgi:hypothetical protein